MKKYTWAILSLVAIFALTATVELWLGRLPLGPEGTFGWWTGDIWSSSQSQRVADPYSFSHIIHGFIFYWFLSLVARKVPRRWRLVFAVLLEAAWEILENSPLIINRYREATISLGYVGDSVLNSLSDIFMVVIGYIFAWRVKPWVTVALIIAIEIVMLFLIRDNLTLNVLMLVSPIEAIKVWQSVGHPIP